MPDPTTEDIVVWAAMVTAPCPLGLISHKARIGVDKGQPGRGSEA
jgi:hypothetical protein